MRWNYNKKKVILLSIILLLLILSYFGFALYKYLSLKKYEGTIYPNIYLDEYNLGHYSYDKVPVKIEFYRDIILSKSLKIKVLDKEYDFKYLDLGIVVDYDRSVSQIKNYQDSLGFSKSLRFINGKEKKIFPIKYSIDKNVLSNFLINLKSQVDTLPVDGYFDLSDGVHYINGIPGNSLNIENSLQVISSIVEKDKVSSEVIDLSTDSIAAGGNETYASIDTMTSSFTTNFMPNTYLRNINLNTALSYINGSIVNPGEVFSYCDKAGPFNKKGYVFYYEFVGNGVCQIATTTYNAALLGGLEIVKRYPHAKKSLYVDGGLDATVASYSSGWCVDMQFKNTYNFPIYIKAYSSGGQAHVEFWSNHDAKGGLEYTTSSSRIGVRGYKSYLHTWKDGQEIDVKEIATTWYTEE